MIYHNDLILKIIKFKTINFAQKCAKIRKIKFGKI